MSEKVRRLSYWEQKDLLLTDDRFKVFELEALVFDAFERLVDEADLRPQRQLSESQFSYLCSMAGAPAESERLTACNLVDTLTK
jgi:hypothetical protein